MRRPFFKICGSPPQTKTWVRRHGAMPMCAIQLYKWRQVGKFTRGKGIHGRDHDVTRNVQHKHRRFFEAGRKTCFGRVLTVLNWPVTNPKPQNRHQLWRSKGQLLVTLSFGQVKEAPNVGTPSMLLRNRASCCQCTGTAQL